MTRLITLIHYVDFKSSLNNITYTESTCYILGNQNQCFDHPRDKNSRCRFSDPTRGDYAARPVSVLTRDYGCTQCTRLVRTLNRISNPNALTWSAGPQAAAVCCLGGLETNLVNAMSATEASKSSIAISRRTCGSVRT